MNPKTTLDQATCARLPAESLAALAGLRRLGGISVVPDGEWAWVFWEADDRVVRALLPVPGLDLFERRGDAWHRPGRRLPSFGVPDLSGAIPLSRAVTPEPFSANLPGPDSLRALPLGLVRGDRPRPTTASLCPLAELGRWADSAPSAAIEAIRGALRGDSALLLGRGLPGWPGATRYWGRRVLVPIGFEPRPALPEEALLKSLGAGDREVLRLVPEGDGLAAESIPLDAFRPLTRAGVRLALGTGSP